MEASPPPAPAPPPPPLPVPGGTDDTAETPSRKRVLPAVVLAGSLGFFGLHRFYAGRYATGALQLVLSLVALKFLWHQFDGLGAAGSLEDVLDWAAQHPLPPEPVLLLSVPVFWALFDCCLLLARRFKDGAGRRMTRWI